MTKPTIMTVYGTRPEAVKLAPLIQAIDGDPDVESSIVVTGQHREMLQQVNDIFGIEPHVNLDVFEPGQGLNQLAAKVFERFDPIMAEVNPDAVLVQGDTTTVATVAVASFYRSIPVVHLEAGLRSHNILSPFPEEANRKIATQVSSLHLAPTQLSKKNLVAENVDPDAIVVTGNTVIDALLYAVNQPHQTQVSALDRVLTSGRRIILASTHRRENWGEPMVRIAQALRHLAQAYADHVVVLPMHTNPKVRQSLTPHLEDIDNVVLIEPLGYQDFTALLARSHIVITDSGGVQEEAPSLGKPVLVLRDNTERPEAVDAGTVRLVGTSVDEIISQATILLDDEPTYLAMARAVNPYGDGEATVRSLAAIKHLLGMGKREPEFNPK